MNKSHRFMSSTHYIPIFGPSRVLAKLAIIPAFFMINDNARLTLQIELLFGAVNRSLELLIRKLH